ncbi:MAG: glycosyltransferase family 39 protein [Candidatus Omnitrophica bacterium]|nr:glycosyltransferase family 39 protein [Candidatus Omnitrophota bacterium]
MTSDVETREPSWDLYAFAILVLFSIFQVMQWPLLPKFLDIYYHLSVMKGFAEAGGYVSRAFWEYAPAGRPHLYPPFFHGLLLGLYQLGLGEITLARLADCAIYPLVLVGLWHTFKEIYGSRFAFFGILIFSSVYSVYLATVTLAPFSLAFFFGILAFLNLEKAKHLRAGLWLGLCFYTHSMMAWSFFTALLVYGLASERHRVKIQKIAAWTLVIAAPWLLHQAHYHAYFRFLNVKENLYLEFDLAAYLLAGIGAWLAIRKKGPWLFPLCLILGMAPMLVTHRFRFFCGLGLAGILWLAAATLDALAGKIQNGRWKTRGTVFFTLAVFFFFHFVSPVLKIDLEKNRTTLAFFDRSVTQYLVPEEQKNFRANGFTIYFKKEYDKIIRAVKDHSGPHDILWSNFSHAGGVIALLSGRSTSNGMMLEVRPFERSDPLETARLLLWFKDPEGNPLLDREIAIKRYGLRPITETDMAYLDENPSKGRQSYAPKPDIANPYLLLIFLGVGAVFFYAYKRT